MAPLDPRLALALALAECKQCIDVYTWWAVECFVIPLRRTQFYHPYHVAPCILSCCSFYAAQIDFYQRLTRLTLLAAHIWPWTRIASW